MRILIARHAETIYNANARMQGQMAHTPLTRAGIAQAEAMGVALAQALGPKPDIDIWASPAGRTLQTVSIVAEHLGHDFFGIRTDPRLLEIDVGDWEGRPYADIVAEEGPILCMERRVFTRRPPNGEWYPAIAERLRGWLADLAPDRDVLVISHGITLRGPARPARRRRRRIRGRDAGGRCAAGHGVRAGGRRAVGAAYRGGAWRG